MKWLTRHDITEALSTHGADYSRVLCAFTAAVARTRHRDGQPRRQRPERTGDTLAWLTATAIPDPTRTPGTVVSGYVVP